MSKAFESIKRGLRQATRHSKTRKQITTKAGYRAALEQIESLMDAKGGTPRGERLRALAKMVEAYEQKHFPKFGDRAPKNRTKKIRAPSPT